MGKLCSFGLDREFPVTAVFILLGWLAIPAHTPAANLVVTNQANSGPGTLRSALTNAHTGDVITFAVTGYLTNVQSGGFVISNNISLVGPGDGSVTITGTNFLPGFQVLSGITASISGLTFYHCNSGIKNSGTLTVSNCVFSSCWIGNGINNSGGLTLNGCTFNDCRGSYGNSYNPEAPPGVAGGSGNNGGAIVNSGGLSALNCQFQNNIAGLGGDGSPGTVATFYYGLYSTTAGGSGGNGGSGGAVYNTGSVGFTNCTFAGNTSGSGGNGGQGGSGGSTTMTTPNLHPGPGWAGGNAGSGGNGGAVFSSGPATFVSCTFYGNTTAAGGNGGSGGNPYPLSSYSAAGGHGGNAGNAGSGTLYCTGACQMVACTFYNNTVSSGGSAGNGGSGGPGAPGGGGGNAGFGGSGGAIYGPRGSGANFMLQNVLLASDTCGYAGSAGSAGASGQGYSGTAPTNGLSAVDGAGPDVSGFFISRGHNFVSLSDGSAGFTNNVRNDIVGSGSVMDALISALADNHGPVPTCALLPGSPALDAGDDTLLASNITTDARGFARLSGTHVDIGAYELQTVAWPVTFASAVVTPGGVQFAFTNTPGTTFTVLGTTDITQPVANWDVLGQAVEVSPGLFQWTDPDYANYDFRFFSLRSP